MKTEHRKPVYTIRQLITKDKTIELNGGQFFCQTPKTFEIWESKPLHRVKIIRNSSVLWVIEK